MVDMNLKVDVAVVGGGMVGAALVCGLARQGFQVALVELREPTEDWPEGSHDLRVSAITRASRNIFEQLGAWEGMQARRVTAYTDMEVWDSGKFGHIHFQAAEIGEAELGHIIENRVIQRSLWDQLERLDGVQLRCPASVTAASLGEERPVLHLDDGSSIESSLIVAADGAGSHLRGLAGIAVKGWLYDQTAVVATVRAELGNKGTAWQRFMPTGPLALLPTEKDLFSIVWSTSPGQADELLELKPGEFAGEVAAASEYKLGSMSLVGERGAFPLRLQHAETYIKPGFALVGDAAHVIHPLAGQGVNLGLLDAAVLVDVLLEARTRGHGLGDRSVLRRYERTRKGDNLAMQAAMDGFKRLFSNDVAPLRLLRNLGLGLVDNMGPAKRIMVRNAMGMTGDLPSLARLES